MPFLPPNQQRQSTEGKNKKMASRIKNASKTDATICIRHQYISNQTMLLAVYLLSIQVILQQQQQHMLYCSHIL